MQNHPQISALLETYFNGLYNSDTESLRSIFHPQALLFGEVSGARYQNTLEGFLTSMGKRESPHQRGEEFRMETLDIELLNQIAYVKARCPMLGRNYFDYLALIHDGQRWLITNKLFTHVEDSRAS